MTCQTNNNALVLSSVMPNLFERTFDDDVPHWLGHHTRYLVQYQDCYMIDLRVIRLDFMCDVADSIVVSMKH